MPKSPGYALSTWNATLRRRRAPIALAALTAFVWSLAAMAVPRVAHAEETVTPATAEVAAPVEKAEVVPSAAPTANVEAEKGAAPKTGDVVSPVDGVKTVPRPSDLDDLKALPTGGDKSGVSSQAISTPQGTGKIQGMGESFSAQLSTGIATFTVPFALPSARGGAQPSLSLSYSSSGGHGVAGVGWEIGAPFIARQTDRGVPGYDDRGDWHPNQDRFVFNGGQELVPICTVGAARECSGKLADEVMPAWAVKWQYFRPRVEGSFLRFFWSDDHKTWKVQSKSGETMELGVPDDDKTYTGGLETDGGASPKIFRWNLTRQYDAQRLDGKPVNVVAYRYLVMDGIGYLRLSNSCRRETPYGASSEAMKPI